MESLLNAEIGLSQDGRQYVLEDRAYDRVTDILHKVLPPYLSVWAQNVGIEAAHHIYRDNGSLPETPSQTLFMAKQMGIDIEGQKEAGGKRGAEVHFANDVWIKEGTPPTLSDFEPEHRPFAQTYCQFLVDCEPEFECAEVTVWNPEMGYAGTFDAVGKITKGKDASEDRLIMDYKTNKDKRIYIQHMFQLAAYRHGLDHHEVPVDGEAVIAIGPSPWKNSGKPYTIRRNWIPARLWEPIVAAYRALCEAESLNPKARSK